MAARVLTYLVVFGTTGLLIVYDVWAAFQVDATISRVMKDLAHRHPIVPFAFGVLMGHIYWGQAAREAESLPSGVGGYPGAETYYPGNTNVVLPLLFFALIGVALILIIVTRARS